jgi:hypothetical protein
MKIKQEEQLVRCDLPDRTKITYLEGLKRKWSQRKLVCKTHVGLSTSLYLRELDGDGKELL